MADPDQAMPAPAAVALLGELGRSLLRIAVISGRDTDRLAARLPLDGLIFVGNHALEAGVMELLHELRGLSRAA